MFRTQKATWIQLLIIAVILLPLFQNCSSGSDGAKSSPSSFGEELPIDPNGPLSIYVRNTEAVQGNDIVFKIEMNRASATPVVVDVETVAGTALPSVAYDHTVTKVTISPGETSALVSVNATGTEVALTDQTMALQATASSTGVIAQRVGSATIKATQILANFKKVAAGGNFTCGITSTDTVKCWGKNDFFQLATSTVQRSQVPLDIAGLTGVKWLSVGATSACAIVANDTVKCWGGNASGQLGNGKTVPSFTPVEVAGLQGVTQVAIHTTHACAITATGVKCWGGNAEGQLGNGTTVSALVPVDVFALPTAKQITVGESHSCALTLNDAVVCWGMGGTIGNGTSSRALAPVVSYQGAKQVAAGTLHTCAIAMDETVMCWGFNSSGQLGNGTLSGAIVPAGVQNLAGVKRLATMGTHTCVITAAGTAKCWGANRAGEVGNRTRTIAMSPVDVMGLTGVKDISAGLSPNTCVVLANGNVKCWGSNLSSQLGNSTVLNTLAFVDIQGAVGYKQIAAYDDYACGITAADTVKCWGVNPYQRLNSSTPVDVVGLSGVKSIAVGRVSACAITGSDSVQCWGDVNGNSDTDTAAQLRAVTPAAVVNLGGAKQLTIGDNHICAIVAGDLARCWGTNSEGQLGTNSLAASSVPANVFGGTTFKAIVAGDAHTCGLTTTGAVKCWGRNLNGELGNGLTASAQAPVDVSGLNGVAQISAQAGSTCVVMQTGGGVKCWGRNTGGELGPGSLVSSKVPIDVTGLTSAKRVVMGENHACAIIPGDRMKCWGGNSSGQLGVNTVVEDRTRLESPAIGGIKQLALANSRTTVMGANGHVRHVGLMSSDSLVPMDVTVTPPASAAP